MQPALSMDVSSAIADFATATGLHRSRGVQAGGLAAQPLNILFQVCFEPRLSMRKTRPAHGTLPAHISRACTDVAPISLRAVDLATRLRRSRRIAMNNTGS